MHSSIVGDLARNVDSSRIVLGYLVWVVAPIFTAINAGDGGLSIIQQIVEATDIHDVLGIDDDTTFSHHVAAVLGLIEDIGHTRVHGCDHAVLIDRGNGLVLTLHFQILISILWQHLHRHLVVRVA